MKRKKREPKLRSEKARKREMERDGEGEREEEAFISGSCVCVRGHATVWHNHTHMHTHTHCATLADIIRNHSCGGRIMEQGARSRKKGARRKGANILWAGQLACWRKYCHLLRHWSYCLSVWRCSNSLSYSHTHTHKRTHLFICTHIYVHIYTEVLKGHLNVCLQLGRSTGRGANTDRRHLGAHYHFRLIGEWAKCHASVSHGTKKTINYLRHLAHLAAIASQRPTVMERK